MNEPKPKHPRFYWCRFLVHHELRCFASSRLLAADCIVPCDAMACQGIESQCCDTEAILIFTTLMDRIFAVSIHSVAFRQHYHETTEHTLVLLMNPFSTVSRFPVQCLILQSLCASNFIDDCDAFSPCLEYTAVAP